MKKTLAILAALAALTSASGAWAGDMTSKHAERGVACASCHGTSTPATKAKSKACMSCHSYADLAKKTAGGKINPHDSHAGELRCTLCHKEHGESTLYCKTCHKAPDPAFDIKVL